MKPHSHHHAQPAANQPLPALSSFTQVYFLGIGGIGMSGLARWFHAQGYTVAGYDRTETPLTRALVAEGMAVSYDSSLSALPAWVKEDKATTLVVLTPAVPAEHAQLVWLQQEGYQLLKRAKVLGIIASGHKCLAVAGTHGKTTTSSLLAHVLHHAGMPVTAFLGGIAKNFNSNLVLSNAAPADTWLVAEADEFDRSFLSLHPHTTVLTSTDADHLDIYGKHEELEHTFAEFVSQTRKGGTVFLRDHIALTVPAGIHGVTFGLDAQNGGAYAKDLTIQDGAFCFTAVLPEQEVDGIRLHLPGYHNVANALAAAAVASHIGLDAEQIKEGLNSFTGVARRFEYVVKQPDFVFIDDYAHHPTEIEAFLKSVRALYPGKRITAVFQPHLFSRTRDFMTGFAQSLALADEVVLLDIYPARELPIPGITSERLLEMIPLASKLLLPKQRLAGYLVNHKTDVLCTIGAGDIDAMVQPIKKSKGY